MTTQQLDLSPLTGLAHPPAGTDTNVPRTLPMKPDPRRIIIQALLGRGGHHDPTVLVLVERLREYKDPFILQIDALVKKYQAACQELALASTRHDTSVSYRDRAIAIDDVIDAATDVKACYDAIAALGNAPGTPAT